MSFSCEKGEFDRFFNRLDRPVEESRPDRFPSLPQTPVPTAAGGFAPRPPASGSWRLRPQAPIGLRRLVAPPQIPKLATPPLRISGYAPACTRHFTIERIILEVKMHLMSR